MTPPLKFDLTVRIGCSLAYEVTGTAALCLNVKPRPSRDHAVVFEALTLGDGLPAEQFTDSHGNAVIRVTLAPGANSIRHDAIVSVSSKPDNHGSSPPRRCRPARCRPRWFATHCPAGIATRTSWRILRGKNSAGSSTACRA